MSSNTKAFEDKMKSAVEHLERELKTVRAGRANPGVLYKVTVDAAGHVSSTTPVTKTDITGLGIPASNTTYSDFKGATANAAGTHGLVPAPAKGDTGKLLSGKGTWEAMTNS